ncbi:MAG: methionine adenosyltransferase [Candidatus Altiarchaeota archaeon]
MRNISVESMKEPVLEEHGTELVERKGVGHPDSICDGLAEAVSRALSKEYVKRFGHIMHHNTDQVELVGGLSSPDWGAGSIDKPFYILLSGRATTKVDNQEIPVGEIAINAAKEYLESLIPDIKVGKDVILDQKIGIGSTDLRDVFSRDGVPRSNDTSFGVSFAPFSLVEKLVYETEAYMNGPMKKKIKGSGTDIKVMGVRYDDKITLTICNAMVSRHIPSFADYQSIMEEETRLVEDFVAGITDRDVKVEINTGDNYDDEEVFVTVTGTSSEQGDDGSVGRGNRANGLITPYRPMSMEATAGKNPVNHVGKLYNLLSKEIAMQIAEAGARQAYVRLMSQIGKPIDQPLCASVQVWGDGGIEKKAAEISDYWLEHVTDLTERCMKGDVQTF